MVTETLDITMLGMTIVEMPTPDVDEATGPTTVLEFARTDEAAMVEDEFVKVPVVGAGSPLDRA